MISPDSSSSDAGTLAKLPQRTVLGNGRARRHGGQHGVPQPTAVVVALIEANQADACGIRCTIQSASSDVFP